MNLADQLSGLVQVLNEDIDKKMSAGEASLSSVSDDPVEWCHNTLGAYYHEKQRMVMRSIRDNRKTAVPAAHGVGKDFCVASVICWWVCKYLRDDVAVLCTAPSNNQVTEVLFNELRNHHHNGHLPGEILTKSWKADTEKGLRAVVLGRAPKAGSAKKTFQGYHNRHLLIVVDEANGVSDDVYTAISGMMTAKSARLVAIGNPDFAEGRFFQACEDEDSDYNVIPISIFDTPNFTKEKCPDIVTEAMPDDVYVADQKKLFGENSPEYRSKVLGLFTSGTSAGHFPFEWILAAREYEGEAKGDGIIISADIGQGGDPTVVMLRHGEVIREVTPHDVAKERDGKKVGKALAKICLSPSVYAAAKGHEQLAKSTKGKKATEIHIDLFGVGGVPYGQCEKDLKDYEDILVEGVNTKDKAHQDTDKYANRKAELADIVRERLREGSVDIDEDDDKLMKDMRAVRMVPSGARIKVLDKKATRKEIGGSTDHYDALALSFNVDATHRMSFEDIRAMIEGANAPLYRENPHIV